jgi:peptide/nickel transport system permease protein
MLRYVLQRAIVAAVFVLVVSSSALMLMQAAPGDHLSGFDLDQAVIDAERHRLGLDRPVFVQYVEWLGRALRLDFGDSLRFQRPVRELVAERARNTALLGVSALLLATLIGIPTGIVTGSRRGPLGAAASVLSFVLVSVPPLVTALALLLVAARTGWLPVGGFPSGEGEGVLKYLILPSLALALPIAGTLERLQSQAMREALAEPCMVAARARGCSERRVIWRHALRLSLRPVLGIYGLVVGAVLSGSFAVEFVTSWPGLGVLMYDGLVGRDLYLVAGCAAAGAAFLALGMLLSDVALAVADPRVGEPS